MKNIAICLALVAGTFAAPVLSFAQSSAPITRAEVRADLVQVEKAGYDPAGDQKNYPANIEAAEAKISAENGQGSAKPVSVKAMKVRAARSYSSLHPVSLPNCVGPVDFCNVYFGG